MSEIDYSKFVSLRTFVYHEIGKMNSCIEEILAVRDTTLLDETSDIEESVRFLVTGFTNITKFMIDSTLWNKSTISPEVTLLSIEAKSELIRAHKKMLKLLAKI